MTSKLQRILLEYAVAGFVTALAVAVRLGIDRWMSESWPFEMMLAAVACAVWYGGYGPAILATVLGYCATNYLFMAPRGGITIDAIDQVVGLFAYLLSSSIIIGFGEQMRIAKRRTDAKQKELEHEIAHRKEVEEKLRQQTQRTDTVLESITDGFYVLDPQWRFIYLNARAERYFHRPRESMLDQSVWTTFPQTAGSDFDQQYHKAVAEHVAAHFEALSPVTGRWLETHAYPSAEGLSVFFQDITERKQAEEQLRTVNQELWRRVNELQTLFDAAQLPIWIAHDPECRRVTGNKYANEITGVAPGTNVSQTPPPGQRPSYRICRDGKDIPPDELPLQSAVARGVPVLHQEIDNVFEDRPTVHLVGNAAPLFDDTGKVRGAVGVFIDITERKQIERALRESEERLRALADALREADRRKDEFLATLAHELRNPLAPIQNAVHLLRMKSPPQPELQELIQMIDRQLGHMVRLVDDLLDVSRITRNKLQLRRERVELTAVVRSAVETIRPLIESFGHELTITLAPEPICLNADLTRLAQVLSNLLSNAAKYTEAHGRIWLTADTQGTDAIIRVKDTGIGISAEDLPGIFEMFSQVAPGLERAQGGLGIGLSLVRRIIEMHGGTVEARSQGLRMGSEFIIRLPLATDSLARKPMPTEPEPEHGLPKRRILVVDDNEDSADSLAMMLEHMGHEVHTAYDGQEAVEQAARVRPDVVLLDIGLPKLNGYDAAQRIRDQPWGKQMLLIAATGWGQREDKRRASEAGFDHHLTKPVDCSALETLLASPRLPRTL